MKGVVGVSSLIQNHYQQYPKNTTDLFTKALGCFDSCACITEPIEDVGVIFVLLAMSMNLSIVLGRCGDCSQEIGFSPGSGKMARRILLLSNTSLPNTNNAKFIESFQEYSDIIFFNLTVLMRMSLQTVKRRKFLPYEESTQFYIKDKIPDLKGINLKGAYYNCSPLLFETINKKQEVVYNGLEIFFLNEFGKAMNFSWTINKMKGEPWGKYDNKTWEGGIIGSVLQLESDIGLCGFWIRDRQYRFVEMTTDYAQMNLLYILPIKTQGANWKGIYTPLSRELWICIAFTLIVSFLALYFLSRLTGQGRDLEEWFFLVSGHFLETTSLPSEGPVMFRIACLCVSLTALFVSTVYSSAIVSHLTNPPKAMLPTTVEELVKRNFLWTFGRETSLPEYLLRLENQWHRMFLPRYRNMSDIKVDSYRYAVLCSLIENLPLSAHSDAINLKNAYYLPEPVSTYRLGFAFKKGSPLAYHASRLIDRLKSGGIIAKETEDLSLLFGGMPVLPFTNGPQPLSMKSLEGAFVILLCGQTIACFVFIIEIFIYSRMTKKIRNLRKDADQYFQHEFINDYKNLSLQRLQAIKGNQNIYID